MATYWENSCSFGLRYVSWYKYLIVSLVFSHLGFWSGNLFLIAPFPDLCLLVPFSTENFHFLQFLKKLIAWACFRNEVLASDGRGTSHRIIYGHSENFSQNEA